MRRILPEALQRPQRPRIVAVARLILSTTILRYRP
jgi:hypothetical protein